MFFNMRSMYKLLYVVVLALTLISSCSKNHSGTGEVQKENVFLNVSSVSSSDTRSVIAGERLDEVHWSEKDRINLYYRPTSSQETMQSQIFTPYRLNGTDAVFTADMPVMTPGIYDYYASYPVPESIQGTVAVYTVDAVQNGSYGTAPRSASSNDGYDKDIMVGQPVTADVLTAAPLSMKFVHKTHVFRIQVPEGRNRLGKDIKKLTVSFPAGVAGTLSVDLSDPAAQPVLTNASSMVTLDLERYLNESVEDDRNGNYVWLFVAPVQVKGKVSFYMSTADRIQTEVLSVEMDKLLEQGRITPVTLTIPAEMKPSGFTFRLGANHLGEPVQKITVRAPQGAKFRNGSDVLTFDVTSAIETYPVEFYEFIDGVDNGAAFRAGKCTVEYESEHAIVRNDFDGSLYQAGQMVEVVKDVPYLLFEDFSSVAEVSASQYADNEVDFANFNLPGWTGDRVEAQAGTSIRIRSYLASSVERNPDRGDNARARVDGPFLTGLKEGASVKIKVKYKVSGTMFKGTLRNPTIAYSTYDFGTDDAAGIVRYENPLKNSVVYDEKLSTDGNYTNIKTEKEFDIPGCTSQNRLAWRAAFRVVDGNFWSVITAANLYVYLDDVRVSIVQ